MPVTIKKSQLLYKDTSTGNYVSVDAVADKTSEQQTNGIQIAANNAISAINDALDDISTEPLTELPKKSYKNDLTTNVESLGSSASKAYSVGDYFYVSDNENDRSLYKVTADIASGGTISSGTAASDNCIPAALAEDVNALSNDLNQGLWGDSGEISENASNVNFNTIKNNLNNLYANILKSKNWLNIGGVTVNGNIIQPDYFDANSIYYHLNTAAYGNKYKKLRYYDDYITVRYTIEPETLYSSNIIINRLIITDINDDVLYSNMDGQTSITTPANSKYLYRLFQTKLTSNIEYFLYKGNVAEIKYYLPNNIIPSYQKILSITDVDFIIHSKNLFDINSGEIGKYIGSSGSIGNNQNYTLFNTINVKPNTYYCLSANTTIYGQMCIFDKNMTPQNDSGTNSLNLILNQPFLILTKENEEFIRFSFNRTVWDDTRIQLEEGTEPTEFTEYKLFIDPQYINIENENEQELITPDKTTFFIKSKNILNVDDENILIGKFINQTNGNEGDNPAHTASDFIPIKPNTTYVYSNINNSYGNYRYAIYNANKIYLDGALNPENRAFTTPDDAAYYRFSNGSPLYVKNSMLEEGSEPTAYTKYALYIDPQYISKEDITNSEIFKVNLPPKIYALVGYETNIYFDNLVDGYDIDYNFNVTCSVGMQLQRCFRLTPTEDQIGSYIITIDVTKDNVTVSKQATIYIASASAKSGQTTSVIIFGDSTTNNGICVTKLNQNFSTDVMNIVTMGSRGTAPNNHEGRSGWAYNTYFTSAGETYTDGRGVVDNPFYNESTQTFDIANYFSETGFNHPDWFIINLGINDTFSYTTDASLNDQIEILNSRCDEVISQIKDFDENIKIGICLTIPPNYSQDAYGKAYKNGQTRNRYKRNNILWVANQIENYKNRENENIYLIPLNLCLDTVYNMGMEEIQVNARNTLTYLSPILNGGVHPVESGYWQCADVYTAFLKNV